MTRRLKNFYQSFPLVELLLKLPPSCLRFPDWRFIFTEMADQGVGDVIEEKRYLCQYCDRIFTSPQAFGGHQNGHKKEKENLKKFQREANQFLAMQHAQQQPPPPPRANVIQPIPLMHHPSPMNMHQNNYHIRTPPPHLIPNNGYLHSNSQPFGFYNNINGAATRFETLYSSPYNISHGYGDGGGGGDLRNATYERIATLNREYYGVAGPSTAVNNGRGDNIRGDDGSKFNANKEGDNDEIDLTLRL